MKVLIVSILLVFGFTQCSETEPGSSLPETLTPAVMNPVGLNESVDKFSSLLVKNKISEQSGCFLSNNFTATLFTTGGARIFPSQVQPNTQYIVRVRLTIPSTPCCQNPAYCFNTAIGFSGFSNDAPGGNTDLRITTDSSLIPGIGIIGVVQAIGCGQPLCGDTGMGTNNNVKPLI